MELEPLSDWSHAVSEIPERGLSRERKATAEVLAQLAEALGLVSLHEVKASYQIVSLAGGAYRLAGTVVALGEQACVVSLEPVGFHLDEPFDVEFWPDLPAAEGGEDQSILDERDVERLDGGLVPTGRVVFETISANLDPYPRKPGAEFTWTDGAGGGSEKVSPFAALAKLRDKL